MNQINPCYLNKIVKTHTPGKNSFHSFLLITRFLLSLAALGFGFASGATIYTGVDTTYDGTNNPSDPTANPGISNGNSSSPTTFGNITFTGNATYTNTFAGGSAAVSMSSASLKAFTMNSTGVTITNTNTAAFGSVYGVSLGSGAGTNGVLSAGSIIVNESGSGAAYVLQKFGAGTITISGGTYTLNSSGAGNYGYIVGTGASTINISGGLFNGTQSGGTKRGLDLAGGTLNFTGSSFTWAGTTYTTNQTFSYNSSQSINFSTLLLDGNTFTDLLTFTYGSNNLTVNFTAVAVPEPSTYLMIFMGLAALLFYRRRQMNTHSKVESLSSR